jgi:hypothetical protein
LAEKVENVLPAYRMNSPHLHSLERRHLTAPTIEFFLNITERYTKVKA